MRRILFGLVLAVELTLAQQQHAVIAARLAAVVAQEDVRQRAFYADIGASMKPMERAGIARLGTPSTSERRKLSDCLDSHSLPYCTK
jgi:hypothetical protein